MAGVHGRHIFTEPQPLMGIGSASPWRRLAWGQDEIVIDLKQHYLIPQTRFTLAEGIDPASDGCHPLADVEIEALAKAVLMVQPQVATICSMASCVPKTTRCVTPTRRRRRDDLTTCA